MTTSSGDGAALPSDIARSVAECVANLERQEFTRRIYEHDATLWRGNEEESRRRLGWLHVCATMAPQSAQVVGFAEAVRRDGFRHVVLLGMGGSSLGSEVLNQVIGGRPDFPSLHVLDSTVPGSVNAVRNTIDLERTLFIVSSKSGSTLEPNLLLEYFLHEVSARAGEESGKQFIAITDPGSSLEKTAREHAFRQVFLNPSEIGGRYSVLSLFGLVPAALLGIDIDRLMAGAARTTEQCRPAVATGNNPGVQLGAYIAACTRRGRDKLTFLTSPGLQSFGLWAEQLIAESTGKEGQGVVPIMGEPSLTLTMYADDRAFVYLRLEGDENAETDRLQRQLADAGFPCLTLNGEDTYSLGGEFYRWEYATAVVGTLLGINPFDQPDVQRAKDASTKVLEHYLRNGALPEVEPSHTPEGLLSTVRPGDYFGILAYIHQRPDTDAVFARFRERIASDLRISTTVGYGPRYLHSTGQLHKGGPNECVLLQIVSGHTDDVRIDGKGCTFGTVADAQALGDLQALLSLGRRVGRIVLKTDDSQLLQRALDSM